MKTGEEYIASLRKLKPVVYYMGEKIDNVVDHPAIRPHINAAAETYNIAHEEQYKDLALATSSISGQTINRFTHIHQNTDDLVKKVKLLRTLGNRVGTCWQRCVGFDTINSLYSTTWEIDQKYGTEYQKRLINYLKYIQENDLMVSGAMTDPKGIRKVRPHLQPNPDAFLRVVSRDKNGIVLRGAKIHITGILNSHELIALPTQNMTEQDKDYAVIAAMPIDTKGITYVFQSAGRGSTKWKGEIDHGNPKYGILGGEALVVFDDVFVPWEKVFMCGETDFCGAVVERFSSFHRQAWGSCRTGIYETLIGATANMADYQGLNKDPHIQDKIAELISHVYTIYSGALSCSFEGSKHPAGCCIVNHLLANVTKYNIGQRIYDIIRLAQDVAGGLIATCPTEADLKSPEVGKWVDKYMQASPDTPTEHRIRMSRLLEVLTDTAPVVEALHGAGSPQAELLQFARQVDMPHVKSCAKKLAGIK